MKVSKHTPEDTARVERLRKAMDVRAVRSIEALSTLMGLKGPTTLRAQVNGQNRTKPDTFERAAKVLQISYSWLWSGEGEMRPKLRLVGSFDPDGETEEDDDGAAVSAVGRRGLSSTQIPERDFRMGAGSGQSPQEVMIAGPNGMTFRAETVAAIWEVPPGFLSDELRMSPAYADIIRIRGDSMDDGSIHALRDGDRVIVDRSDIHIRQGGIFAVSVQGEVIVKQVELVPSSDPVQISCKSLNRRYSDQLYILEDEARIIGRVAAAITRR